MPNDRYERFHWFGDSWVAGAELDPRQGMFCELVSKHYDVECINHGIDGSTVDSIPMLFTDVANKLNDKDLVFFCLTDFRRTTIHTDQGATFLSPSKDDALAELWYKHFDSDIHARHTHDKTINFLYLWCKHIGVDCFFANIFSVPDVNETLNLIPEDNWILTRNDFLARSIIHINELDLVSEDRYYLLEEEWKEQEKMLDTFFKPNKYHPNLLGHKQIADEIVKDLCKYFV